MKVAITGGTGFIGRRLVQRHAAAGDTVRVLTRRPSNQTGFPDAVRVHTADLASGTDAALLSQFVQGADVVYHCAGEISNESRMRSLHVDGTRRLIEAAEGRIGHWVQLSSVGAYGPHRCGAVTEETPLRPVGAYETSKAESDELVQQAARSGSFSCTVLRPSIVFGPGMKSQSLRQMGRMIDRGIFFFIGLVGASANYICVENVIEALVSCGRIPAAKGRVYDISDRRTIEEFVAVIADALRKPCPNLRIPERLARFAARTLGKVPSFPLTESRVDALTSRAVYPADRIERELNYVHPVTMEDGLSRLVGCWKIPA
ncbi:MAG: NAD-dependent epimerase/dehydratase family protein [Candidatus Korobacteraceae bacterium]|jgi:nucleoside-diphosphate-sugar epimerase